MTAEGSRTSLRVLHVLTTNQRRGAEMSAVTLRDELIKRGHQARAVALVRATTERRLDIACSGRRQRLSHRVLRLLRQAASECDVVVAHGSTTLPACALALLGHPTPFVYANIGDPLFWADSRSRRKRVRLLARRAAGIAARSERSLAVLRDEFGVPESRLVVIPNGRRIAHFPLVTADSRAASRQMLGLDPNSQIVVTLGALGPEKRIDVAIRAVSMLPGVVLLVAGDGAQRCELETMAAEIAPGRVHFLGQVSDVPSVLAAADALLLTSDSEGLPGALIEAGLCGLPVVTTDVGYVRDIVIDGQTGLVVPRDDPPAATHALRTVLDRRDEMGTAARKRCLAEFDMERVAERWEALLLRAHRSVSRGDA